MAPLKKSTVSKVTPVKSRAIITKAENKKIYPYYSNHEKAKYFSIDSFVKEEFAGDLSEEDCYCFEKILGKDLKDRVVFDFQICQTAHTCGFLEVGDLDVICKEENISHLKEMLDALPRWSKGYTMFMNTNGIDASEKLEKVLPLTKHWKKVKTYLNPGTKRILTLWVTNN